MHTASTGITNKDTFFPASQLKQHSVVNTNTPVTKNNDETSIGILTPEKTQAILNRQIADKLEERFKAEGIDLTGLQAEDFTPEKVSERIMGFVSGRILSEEDKDKQTELMEQARKGIEQGFSEAREILDSLDVLNGKVKDDIDLTYDLVQQGLARLQDQINGILPEEPDQEDSVASAQIQQASLQSSFSRNENTRVEITTRDGDKVLIDLSRQQNAESLQTLSRSEEGDNYSVSRSISASVGINYQVQGELDEDEQKAIDDLLKDVAKVSDSFFSGNVQSAFKKAMEMDFNSEELTNFSLNLDFKESRQAAISTYSEYQSQSQPVADSGAHSRVQQPGLKELSDFIRQMDHLFQNPFAAQKFADPDQGIGDLLRGMNQLLHSDEMKKLQNDSTDLLDSLVNQMKQFHGNEVTDAKDAAATA